MTDASLAAEPHSAEKRPRAAMHAGDVTEIDRLLDDRLIATLMPSVARVTKEEDLRAQVKAARADQARRGSPPPRRRAHRSHAAIPATPKVTFSHVGTTSCYFRWGVHTYSNEAQETATTTCKLTPPRRRH